MFTKNYKSSIVKLTSLLLLTLIFNSCTSIKTSASKSGVKYFETFFAGKEGTQYFIKPLLLENKNSKEEMDIDFTFRYKDQVKDSAQVNFSIRSSKIYKNISSLNLSNGESKIESNNLELLFNEHKKDQFISRFTTKLSLNDVKQLFNNSNWIFTTKTNEESNEYRSTNKTIKKVDILKNKLFILM